MEILIGVIYLIGRLIYESIQGHRADRYADMVARRYNDDKDRRDYR